MAAITFAVKSAIFALQATRIKTLAAASLDIFAQSQTTVAQGLTEYFGPWSSYYQQALLTAFQQPTAANQQVRQIVSQRIFFQLQTIWQNLFNGYQFADGAALKQTWQGLSPGQQAQALQLLSQQLANVDANYRQFLQPTDDGKKSSGASSSRLTNAEKGSAAAEMTDAAAVNSAGAKPAVSSSSQPKPPASQPKKVVPPVQSQTYDGQLSALALQYLDGRRPTAYLDHSFGAAHPVTLLWKPNLQVDRSVSKIKTAKASGKLRPLVLDDLQVGFLPWLKGQLAQAKIFSAPGQLEQAFSKTGPLPHVSKAALLEAQSLIMKFSVAADWSGLAAVLHGRYATEYVQRRRHADTDLLQTQLKNGLVDQMLAGKVEPPLAETAFWYYLAKWAYSRVDFRDNQDRQYLEGDESQYSQEGQRILATLRSQQAQVASQTTGNDGRMRQQLNTILEQNRALTALLTSLMAQSVYRELLADNVNPKAAQAARQAYERTLVNGKLSPQSKQALNTMFTRAPMLDPIRVAIQHQLPELMKQQKTYEETARRSGK